MSYRRAVTFVVLICAVVTFLPLGTPTALAFSESAGNNFFGTNPASNTGTSLSFFGGNAGIDNTSGTQNSFFGRGAGENNTTGGANSFFGAGAGDSNTTGSLNSFFGVGAGSANTASANSFFGWSAGQANQTGDHNAFFGIHAGSSNTSGDSNAFYGSNAGVSNTTACCNTFFGRDAGAFNTAPENSFFGRSAGFANTTGTGNAFFGFDSGHDNTTGDNNTFLGYWAGRGNTTGISNTFVGRQTGNSTTEGSFNAMVGTGTGFANTTGDLNAFFGAGAGTSNTTESGNTIIGTLANGAPGVTNATAIGHRAQVSGVNRLVLGSIAGVNDATSNVNVGIGTPTPAEPLHVRRTDGTAKVLVQEASPTLLGRELFELVNNGAARFRVRNTSNNATWDFQSSSNAGSFVIDRVGGPTSLDFEMQPDGDLVVRGTVTATSFITSSDRNLKTDITPANARKLMSLLRQLDISTWRFRNEPEGTVNLGPMAQDFHRLFGMGTETTVQVRDLAALALVAAQAQQKEIDELKRAVAELSSTR